MNALWSSSRSEREDADIKAREWNWAESVLSLNETPLQQIHVQPFSSSSFILSSIFLYITHSQLSRTERPTPSHFTNQRCPTRNNRPAPHLLGPSLSLPIASIISPLIASYTRRLLFLRVSSYPNAINLCRVAKGIRIHQTSQARSSDISLRHFTSFFS